MNIGVKIQKLFSSGQPLKAIATVFLDGGYAVHNVRVIQSDNGPFLGMPYESFQDQDGCDWRVDVFHPVTAEARKALESAVLAAYREKISEKLPDSN